MENSLIKITHDHGREMYCIALKHAIEIIKTAGDAALPFLEEQLEKERKEIENE